MNKVNKDIEIGPKLYRPIWKEDLICECGAQLDCAGRIKNVPVSRDCVRCFILTQKVIKNA